MTSKSAKKVVIINDIKSTSIEQAIFILKDKEGIEFGESILDEANKIVQNYIRQVGGSGYRSVKSRKKWFWQK